MDKSRRNQYASTKMFAKEKDSRGNPERLELFGNDGKASAKARKSEDKDFDI